MLNDFYLFLRNYSGSSLLNEVKKLDSNSDQLYIIGNWADEAEKYREISTDTYRVIEYALDLAITSAEYAPNAGLYRNYQTN